MIEEKLQEYIALLDFNNEYYRNSFRSNLNFIKYAISKLKKQGQEEIVIIQFIQDTIDIHKRIYIK